jgi:hypothetical protein
VCCCELGSKDCPIEIEESSEDGLSYAMLSEEEIKPTEPLVVHPAVSGQTCIKSKNRVYSRLVSPALSPSVTGPACTASKIRVARVDIARVISGLQSTWE